MTSINIISKLHPNPRLEQSNRPNMVYAWFLNKWLRKAGVDSRFVSHIFHKTHKLTKADKPPQIADYTLITSRSGYSQILGTPGYYEKLKKLTKKKIAIYLCSDLHTGRNVHLPKYFDHIFTQVQPKPGLDPKYVYAGWGADPEYCYPEKKEKAVYLDSLMYEYYKGRYDSIYKIYEETIPKLEIKLYHPLPRYKGTKRTGWLTHQKLVRASHFYCLTQPGEGGLTRLEAATGGALLVVPEAFSKLRSISGLERRVWKTEEDLIKILEKPLNARAIRKKALEHSWEKTVERILRVLEGDA